MSLVAAMSRRWRERDRPGLVSEPALTSLPLAFAGRDNTAPRCAEPSPLGRTGSPRVGVICNPKSHRNRGAYAAGATSASCVAVPRTHFDLSRALTCFAEARIDVLVIDGGDGTVRDVLTGAGMIWKERLPTVAVIPSGRTNALAMDLDLPIGWSIDDALASVWDGRVVERRPLEVTRTGSPVPLRGFLFGAGAFVTGTELALANRPAGPFSGMMVGMAVGMAVLNTVFGDDAGRWRAGTPMRLHIAGEVPEEARRYLLLASTLRRLPMNLKIFGRGSGGLRLLDIDGPPRRILAALPPVLTGRADAWLARQGYRRREAESFGLDMESDFVLDGERFAGGSLTVGRGFPIQFVTR